MISNSWNWLYTTISAATFSDWADVLSVFSAVIGCFVYFEIKKLKRESKRRRKIESLFRELTSHVVAYQKYLREVDMFQNEILQEFARVENSLGGLLHIMSKKDDDRERVQNELKKVRSFKGQTIRESDLRVMHYEMVYFEGKVKEIWGEIYNV